MRPCVCGGNRWKYSFDDETRRVAAECVWCGVVVTFQAKPRKPVDPNKIEALAEYEIRDGKHFLKLNGEFVEVELCKVNNKGQRDPRGKCLRVMPI